MPPPWVPPPWVPPPRTSYGRSGTSGHKARGLVCDTGGYCAGVAHTMEVVFDARPGEDVMYTEAEPSWITGQTYGISGPLCARVASLVVHGLRDDAIADRLPQNFSNLVKQLGVTLHVSGASFLKRLLRDPAQAAWLRRQNLCSRRARPEPPPNRAPPALSLGMRLARASTAARPFVPRLGGVQPQPAL